MASTGTSRVIDSLQREIDDLKRNLLENRETLNETKQKYSILQKRNETMLEQLSNSKHQAEVAESMLKRKERRVLDLENQLTDSLSNYDAVKFDHDKLKLSISSLNNDKLHFQNENERLDSAYQSLNDSFNSYKSIMNQKVDDLNKMIPKFINDREKTLNDNINLLKSQHPELSNSYNSFVRNSKRLEQLYNQKYEKVNDSLLLLANATKQHGQSTSIILDECEDILKKLNRNEDIIIKIEENATGPLSDMEKINQFKKFRDLSILCDSTNVTNNSTKLNNYKSNGNNNNNNSNSNSNNNNNGKRQLSSSKRKRSNHSQSSSSSSSKNGNDQSAFNSTSENYKRNNNTTSNKSQRSKRNSTIQS